MEWCNANADYFLTVESIPGAHDIFFAFAGGPGPNAGVISVTLGPACAPTIPTGCIPSHGETIFVMLWTLKKGLVVPPSPFSYTFIAANNVTPTATTVEDSRVFVRSRPQGVTLTAKVAADSTVTQGTVTFTVLDGATTVGTAVTSAVLTSGGASVVYSLPAGMAPKSYHRSSGLLRQPSSPAAATES